MSKRSIGCVVSGIIIYLVFAAILVTVTLFHREDFNSSPTASRDVYGFKSGEIGLLKEPSKKTEQVRPASVKMATPTRYSGWKNSFVLQWKKNEDIPAGSAVDPWVDGLLGDDQIDLIAFATWTPQPDDPISEGADWHPSLTFRDSNTLEILSADQIAALQIPPDLFSLPTPGEYQTPRLSLLFRTQGMPYVRFTGIDLGDARTGAKVSHDLERLGEQTHRSVTIGDWTRLDAALLTWHDISIECRARVLTGKPVRASLDKTLGEQIVFGDHLRIQWLESVPGSPIVTDYINSFKPAKPITRAEVAAFKKPNFFKDGSSKPGRFHIYLSDSSTRKSAAVIRASSPTYLKNHCALMTPAGPNWDWDIEEEDDSFLIASIDTPTTTQPAELIFLPHITELKFEIRRLPDLPNPGSPEDLFENRLPRITLPADITDAERQLIGYVGVGAQVAWDLNMIWDDHPPRHFPSDNTFRNETPQSLLNWYLDNTPQAHITFDDDGLILRVNEEKESWWDRFVDSLSIWNLL